MTENPSATDELDDCPFCGCHGLSFAWPRARGRMVAIIECHTDGCYATIEADTQREAKAAWNRRAGGLDEAATLAAENARLREALQQIANSLDCGCVPCTGQCRSRYAMEIEVEARQDIVRAALIERPTL